MSDFAKNLRKYRKRKNLSQVALGKRLNYGSTAIANYESGRNEPSFNDLVRLTEVLEVTADELIGIELTTEESRLISSFKKLDVENKNRILDLMQALQH